MPHGLRTCVGLLDADGPVFLFCMWGMVRKVHFCCRSVIVEDMAFVRPTNAELAFDFCWICYFCLDVSKMKEKM